MVSFEIIGVFGGNCGSTPSDIQDLLLALYSGLLAGLKGPLGVLDCLHAAPCLLDSLQPLVWNLETSSAYGMQLSFV